MDTSPSSSAISDADPVPTQSQASALDGNAAAGAFAAAFGVDLSAAEITCAQCDDRSALAQARAYVQAPGVTLRCRSCSWVLARITTTPHGTWLSLAGSSSWRLPPQE